MATKGRLNLGFNSGTYDSSEGKNLPPQPPLSMSLNGITRHLVVANESTGSHPQEDVTSRVLVENKSTGSHSSTGTSAAFDVANGSTGSHSKTGASAALAVANGPTGYHSNTGASAALDVANVSTRSDSKSVVLSEADTEIASVENWSATCSSLGDSSKEGSDHTDSPNQNHVPKYGRHFDTTGEYDLQKGNNCRSYLSVLQRLHQYQTTRKVDYWNV